MFARLNRPPNLTEASDTPSVYSSLRLNYFKIREEKDPSPYFSLLDQVDSVQTIEVSFAMERMLQNAADGGFPEEHLSWLRKLLRSHSDVFLVSLSSGPFAYVPPLKVNLVPDARPTTVLPRNYSPEQRDFRSIMVEELVANSLAYSNRSSHWASAPLLVSKPVQPSSGLRSVFVP